MAVSRAGRLPLRGYLGQARRRRSGRRHACDVPQPGRNRPGIGAWRPISSLFGSQPVKPPVTRPQFRAWASTLGVPIAPMPTVPGSRGSQCRNPDDLRRLPRLECKRVRLARTAAGYTGGAFDAAQKVKMEQRLGIAFARMAHRGVPAAATIDCLTPGDRVIGAHCAAGIGRLVERRQDLHRPARIAAKIVPFVGALPGCRQALGRGMS